MRWLWAAGGLLLVAVGVGVALVGLERADQVASVVGACAGVAGLAVSLVGLRRPARREQPPAGPPASGRTVTNTIENSVVHGPAIQIGSVDGNAESDERDR
ncbi:hypothetical protein [Saccharothrix australiensis]|uniref:Uncharacterized protein n=1 Tax=Saccharothrix australiensis TaxID=2072 RepID=A0A495VV41_9PSEU|nr:hypothetical protein [Saccharothrix australiensis]RKT52353.1 hypothetical protein C8E97_0863 [Saccharothrix australiensis]